jgi:hypothetical protein
MIGNLRNKRKVAILIDEEGGHLQKITASV